MAEEFEIGIFSFFVCKCWGYAAHRLGSAWYWRLQSSWVLLLERRSLSFPSNVAAAQITLMSKKWFWQNSPKWHSEAVIWMLTRACLTGSPRAGSEHLVKTMPRTFSIKKRANCSHICRTEFVPSPPHTACCQTWVCLLKSWHILNCGWASLRAVCYSPPEHSRDAGLDSAPTEPSMHRVLCCVQFTAILLWNP